MYAYYTMENNFPSLFVIFQDRKKLSDINPTVVIQGAEQEVDSRKRSVYLSTGTFVDTTPERILTA
jgi:hypothetical protein